jgi:NAD(P)-dependent dehydrogenase (short-subunit alcohol dehydrogenase family)
MTEKPIAIVTGVGPGTGAAIVKRFSAGGFRIIALPVQRSSSIPLRKSFPTSTRRNRLDRKTSERSDQGEGRTTVTKNTGGQGTRRETCGYSSDSPMPKSIFSRPNSCFGWTKQSRLSA